MGASQKALPHGILGERVGAALVNQTLHDLVLRAQSTEDSPASHLAVGSLGSVTAVQTWRVRAGLISWRVVAIN